MKNAIILAGGLGTRLKPLTQVVNKQLLPINGKFIIEYPLSTLKNMGIENVTVVLGGTHFSQIVGYLQDGVKHGLNFDFVYQNEPKGIAHAINLCKRHVLDDNQFVVILGDNIYERPVLWNKETKCSAQIVLHDHAELHRFGVASINADNKIVKIIEKPKEIDASYKNYAITGCYLFDQKFFEFYKKSTPSTRGEYEITDIIHQYNAADDLSWTISDGLWSDAGTHESINYLNNYYYQLT
jgi:glucose-1-phosphate thymidylyltransferase